ncbi:ABC transporter permease [Niallia sp. 03133]|uniref:ABC transporter permease n=1 Tax=Niallia sp. 03133 TaxID=3458060 RepID=UPI004043C6B2
MFKKINYQLLFGIVLLLFFLFVSFFGSHFAPYAEDYALEVGYIQTDKGEELVAPPLSPSKEFLFGTDKWGYDIFSHILYGAKYTVLTVIIVAGLRLLIGTVFGMVHALTGSYFSPRKSKIAILNSIPPVVIIYFIMKGININPSLSSISLVIIQAVLMSVLGIAGVYDVVYAKTGEVKQSLYVMASETLGGSRWHIMKKHIFPILRGNLSVLYVNETIQVLHLIGQLGIFGLFFGGTIFQPDSRVYLSMTNEWSGLIGQSRSFFNHSQWIMLFPLLGYVMLLFAFYLLSAGLKEQEKRRLRKNMYL